MPTEAHVLRTANDLTAAWLRESLGTGPVVAFDVEQIGTGQMSRNYRVAIEYKSETDAGPRSVVLKTASPDETSRGTGLRLGIYEREIRFYRELAPRLGGPLAACHVAALEPEGGWFTLVLEDAAPAVQGDQIAGCTVEEARLAIHELAKLHGAAARHVPRALRRPGEPRASGRLPTVRRLP
jgi:Ecdysteroid kinase-like family